jgi:VanZ family protein
VPSWLWGFDKLAHAGLYAILGATLGYGRMRTVPPPSHGLPLAIGVLYGASDEWHQAFVGGRSADPVDWVADAVGVLVGYGAFVLAAGRRARRGEDLGEGVDVRS